MIRYDMKVGGKFFEKDNISSEIIDFLSEDQTNCEITIGESIQEDFFEWFNTEIVDLMTQKQCVKYAIFAAEQVIDIFEKRFPGDERPREAIEAAKRYIKDSSEGNIDAAYAAAQSDFAACSVHAADAAWAAASAVDAAVSAVRANREIHNKIIEYGLEILGRSGGMNNGIIFGYQNKKNI